MSERSKRSLTRRCPFDTWGPRVPQDMFNRARTGAAPGAGSGTRRDPCIPFVTGAAPFRVCGRRASALPPELTRGPNTV